MMMLQQRRQAARRGREGLTLVELLVVLAIIGLVAGIAVPTFVRVASQSRNALRETALDLQECLRATRILAQTRRLDTGLAYLIQVEEAPSGDGVQPVAYIDGVIAARSPSTEEIEAAGFRDRRDFEFVARQFLDLPQNARIFVPVPLRGPEVRPLRGEGGLYSIETARFPESGDNPLINNPGSAEEEMGIVPVYLLDHQRFLSNDLAQQREERLELLEPRAGFGEARVFPAHVFQPNGVMRSNSSRQRFELIVSPKPNADPFELWADPWGESPGFTGDRQRLHYRIEVYASLGRVRLGTELLAGFEP